MIRPLRGALLAVGLSVGIAEAHAAPEPPSAPWPRREADVRATREGELSERLTRAVGLLSGVEEAQALVSLPAPEQVPLDQPLPAPRVTLVVRAAQPPPETSLRQLLAAAGLKAAHLTVLPVSAPRNAGDGMRPSAPAGAARDVRMRTILLASLLSNALLSGLILWLIPHRRQAPSRRSEVS